MPGGRINPLSISSLIGTIEGTVSNAKDSMHSRKTSLTKKLEKHGLNVPYVDLIIQFIGASGLPKMDVVGSADPYFVAKIDDAISFVSTVKQNELAPVWNETWRIKNVPATADLVINVMDKDEGSVTDDFIGTIRTGVSAGAKELEIESPLLKRSRGTFWIKIESKHAQDPTPNTYPYLFNGPVRFSRHFSPTVGALTNLDEARLYSTWKMFIMGIPHFFGDVHQPWNRNYKAAQTIFQGPTSVAVRSTVQAGHRLLYARTANNGFGIIDDAADVNALLQSGDSRPGAHRVKPVVYTYIISSEDDSFRFSETGAAFFVDFASKHALHANCFETVRYSGEFHPRPKGGWENFKEEVPDNQVDWELVIDNNSGTYAPDKKMLPTLRALLEYNFPGFAIFALHHEDEDLKKSVKACRDYALKYRGVKPQELEPHAREGEDTLCHQASLRTRLGKGIRKLSNEKASAS
ncbi:C2-domain-containing protein [Crepidotus variabilis]|uniref:C2-domain-containing protein n=1 Tax=Crepidotus variabilis TaxID=179855 RepID=A0A9P6JPK4_9AGAR|nr:C2-domain-containing protein [Crepidotus variabilis]